MRLRVGSGEFWRSPLFLVGLAVSAHLALALIQVGRDAFWLDEFMSVSVVTGTWNDAVNFFRTLPEQHPVYYVLLWAWTQVSTAEGWVRALSSITSAASIPLVYLLGRKVFERRVGLCAAWVVAISPYALYYAGEARMYSLALLLSLATTLLLLDYLRSRELRTLGVYALIALIGIYTHFFLVLLVLSLGLAAIALSWSSRRVRRELLVTHAGLVVLFTPWLLLIAGTALESGQDWKGASHLIFSAPYTLFRFVFGFGFVTNTYGWQSQVGAKIAEDAFLIVLGGITVVLALSGGILGAFRRMMTAPEAGARYGATLLLVSLAGPFLITILVSPLVILAGDRYFVVSFAAFAILLSSGLFEFVRVSGPSSRRWTTTVLLGTLLIPLLTASARTLDHPEVGYAQWDQAAAFLNSHAAGPDDLIVAYPEHIRPILTHYVNATGPDLANDLPARALVSSASRLSDPPELSTQQSPNIWLVLAHTDHGPADLIPANRLSTGQGSCWLFPRDNGIIVWRVELARPPRGKGPSLQTPDPEIHCERRAP